MSTRPEPDTSLREAMQEEHRALTPPTPNFQHMWKQANRETHLSTRRFPKLGFPILGFPKLGLGVAASLCLFLGVVLFYGALPSSLSDLDLLQVGETVAMTPEQALRFAEELNQWDSALAFLDEAPGSELFDSYPELELDSLGLDEVLPLETLPSWTGAGFGTATDPIMNRLPPAA